MELAVLIDQRQERVFLYQVDLVDKEKDRRRDLFERFNDEFVPRSGRLGGLNEQEDHVHFIIGRERGVHHVLVHFVLGFVDTGSVDEHELGVGRVHDAEDPVPRGLGLVGDDGDLFAEQMVEECGLADIRTADDRDEA